MKSLKAKIVSEGESALAFQCQSYLTGPVVRTWKSQFSTLVSCKSIQLEKALLWEDACVWRPQFPKCTGPFPAHFVCLLWDGTVVARPWSCLSHHPLNSPLSTRPPACPSCPGESGNIFGNLVALRACPGKCFAGFFWSRQVICKELGEILHFLP